MQSISLRRVVISLILLVPVLIAGSWLGYLSGVGASILPGASDSDAIAVPAGGVQSAALSAQVADPCAHLDYVHYSRGEYYREEWTVADNVAVVQAVAKGVITQTRAPRFDTLDGGPPPPLPTDATEEEEDSYPDRILSAVVIDSTETFTGTSATGFVILKYGGRSADCPDYEYVDEPIILAGSEGDEGVVFGSSVPAGLYTDPPNWLQYAESVAAEVELVTGGQYDVLILDNWYLYDGTDAVSVISPSPIAITQLEAEIEAAVTP